MSSTTTTKTVFVDSGLMESIGHFVLYGLDPGSCGREILKGNYLKARAYAHHALTHWRSDSEEDVIANMIEIVRRQVPAYILEDIHRWIEHGGLEGASDAAKVQWRLGFHKHFWEQYQINQEEQEA